MVNPIRSGRLVSTCMITRVLAAALLLVLTHSAAIAQQYKQRDDLDTPGLLVEWTAGWDGHVDRTAPVPLSFLLRNDTDHNLDSVLTIYEPNSGREVVLGEITVSPHTNRRFTAIRSMPDWFECYARLSVGHKTIWRRPIDINTGKSFDKHSNYALFVEESERKLELPSIPVDPALLNSYGGNIPISGRQGRHVQSLTARPWQIPNHPGAMDVIQAIIFPDGASERQLNAVQWKAVAQWMCQGGTIFVHKASQDIVNRLRELAPLHSATEGQPFETFTVQRIGLGAIYQYDRILLTSDGAETRRAIAQFVARLDRTEINTFSDVEFFQFKTKEDGQADRNRNLILCLFGVYAFLSGIGSLLLYRLSQRQIAVYMIVIVALTSFFAAGLGGYMRLTKGDLQWRTVTQAGVGGLAQVGTIEVKSAGSRNTQLAIKGDNADLQFIGTPLSRYYYGVRHQGYSPFTWQPNLDVNESDAYRIHVPISPWGRRRCHAMAFRHEPKKLDVELSFTPTNPNAVDDKYSMPSGKVIVKIDNQLPFDIYDCRLVIGISRALSPEEQDKLNNTKRQPNNGYGMQQINSIDGMKDAYFSQGLSTIVSGKTLENESAAHFQPNNMNWGNQYYYRAWNQPFEITPRIEHMGAVGAWIIGKISNSPIISIDEDQSDFVPIAGEHYFVQELLPEEMPDLARFLVAAPPIEKNSPATDESSEQAEPK